MNVFLVECVAENAVKDSNFDPDLDTVRPLQLYDLVLEMFSD